MRQHTRSKWLRRLASLLAAAGLAVGATACEQGEQEFEEMHEQTSEAQEQEFGATTGEQPQEIQQEEEFGLGQQDQQAQTEQQDQQQVAQQPEQDLELGNLDPQNISEQDLRTFARLKLQIEQQQGQVGGGPAGELPELSPQQTAMIQNAGMTSDRYQAINMLLQNNDQFRQRYQQVLQQIHDQPADLQEQQQGDRQEQDQQIPAEAGEDEPY